MVYQVLNEGKVDLSWRNTELEMLLGYHNRDANSSQKYHPRCFLVVLVVKKTHLPMQKCHPRIQEKAGSRRRRFGYWSVCGLRSRRTQDHQGRQLCWA